jgi:thiaminase
MNNKDFDSVQMMREIRENHHKMYENNPELREKRLEEIRIKYARQIRKKEINRAVSDYLR